MTGWKARRNATLVALVAACLFLPATGAASASASKAKNKKAQPASTGTTYKPLGSSSVAYLVLTYDGKTLDLYVNGRLAASHAEPGPADAGGSTVELGSFLGRERWDGAIDELALYRLALSPSSIAEHYRLGTGQGSAYPAAVKRTPGAVAYWRLDDSSRLSDSIGHARGSAEKSAAITWYGLLAGSHDPAIALTGAGGDVQLTGVPRLPKFSIETWVLPGPHVLNTTIVSRPGAWFLKTDLLGHWSGGFFHSHHIVSVASTAAAKSPHPATPAKQPAGTNGGSKSDGTSPAVSIAALAVIAALVAAAVPIRRRRRRSALGEGGGDGEAGGGDGEAGGGDGEGEPPEAARNGGGAAGDAGADGPGLERAETRGTEAEASGERAAR